MSQIFDIVEELEKERKKNKELENIIDELEKYLEHRLSCSINGIRDDEIRKAMNKLNELKGDNK